MRLKKIIIFFFFYPVLLSSKVNTIEVDFSRQVINKKKIEKTSGKIYYNKNGNIIISTIKPLKQLMIIKSNNMIIYYPDEKKAFKIKQKMNFNVFFFEAFLGDLKENLGLSELGYTLVKNKKKNKILYTYWNPPEKVSDKLGQLLLANNSDKVIYAEQKDQGGDVISQTDFSNHIKYKNYYFPLKIISNKFNNKNKITEKIIFSDPKFNKPFPLKINNFKLPPKIKIESLQW